MLHYFCKRNRSKMFFLVLLLLPIVSIFWSINRTGDIPIRTVVDLNAGESQKVRLSKSETVEITLLETEEKADELSFAVRSASVKAAVNGQEI